MPQRKPAQILVSVAGAGLIALMLAGCSGLGTGMALATNKVEGYQISQDALAQIRPGQSQDLVETVLGSPQTINAFNEGSAWYYVETRVSETAFGLTSVQSRTVLAVYFDKDKRVADKALYSAKDGKVFTIEGRKTPSYGEDKSFIQSMIDSL
ncbi:MAG TPA: outer membrane protein assembly factor BamE [Devosia sp.]|jgi:outer membrane protein assembly factor BamE (lipoprotein component of BamABCDE complex)|nr:outer membrane protein assembly factor BamE [Devosia sp.]